MSQREGPKEVGGGRQKSLLNDFPPTSTKKRDDNTKGVGMGLNEILESDFLGHLPLNDFFTLLDERLLSQGFVADNTLACVATCRDELCQPLISGVREHWGEAFDLNGLAGYPAGGLTAINAASHHAPVLNGKRRMLVIGMAHIAIGPKGEVGVCHRPGIQSPSHACGALHRLEEELNSEAVNVDGGSLLEEYPDDVEYGLLKHQMANSLPVLDGVDIGQIMLTKEADKLIQRSLHRFIQEILDPDEFKIAMVTGIMLHLPKEVDHIWVSSLSVSSDE